MRQDSDHLHLHLQWKKKNHFFVLFLIPDTAIALKFAVSKLLTGKVIQMFKPFILS